MCLSRRQCNMEIHVFSAFKECGYIRISSAERQTPDRRSSNTPPKTNGSTTKSTKTTPSSTDDIKSVKEECVVLQMPPAMTVTTLDAADDYRPKADIDKKTIKRYDRLEVCTDKFHILLDDDEPFIHPWQPSVGDRTMYEGHDMPSTDVAEDHVGPEPQVLPLDVSKLNPICGYEGVGYYPAGTAPLIPTPPHCRFTNSNPIRREEHYSSVDHITADEARNALMDFASSQCCYGKAAAETMDIIESTPSCVYHYTLQTYTEVRGVSWEQEPFRGQPVDRAQQGKAPLPWSIECEAKNLFQNEIYHIEIPHTATVIKCNACDSHGWLRCYCCLGRGFKRCSMCNGSGRDWRTDAHGHRHADFCWHCNGTGRKRCSLCDCDGRICCKTCSGFRKLKCYLRLTITFKNNTSETIINRTELSFNVIKKASGSTVFEQKMPQLLPIKHFPDRDVCRQSQRLINEHCKKFDDARIIIQEHKLRIIPVVDCIFRWKNRQDHFWVFGTEQIIHAPSYPQRWCWGCIIL